MAYTVTTYTSTSQVAAALTAVVTQHFSEDSLNAALATATAPFDVLFNGGYYILIDNPQIVNNALFITWKGPSITVAIDV